MGMIIWCFLILGVSSYIKAKENKNWRGLAAYWVVLGSALSLGYLDFKFLSDYMFNFTNHWETRYFIQTFAIFIIEALIIVSIMVNVDKTWHQVPIVKKIFGKTKK